uniref:BZIP domain-containing protein n=1 Tax=Arion vulgaris TaxID=1028688 RepID=A0A0B6ZP12_9EUPU
MMDSQTLQKSKRGRKRQSDEECLSDADRLKKEKNRKAAQKCREKKEKEANDLKIRNEELERENKKLSEEKKKLEERAQEFHKIILYSKGIPTSFSYSRVI